MLQLRLIHIIIFFSLFLGNQVTAQDSARNLKRRADFLIGTGHIHEAVPYLERYCIKKPDDIKSARKLAECCSLIRDYSKAADWYLKVYEADKEFNKEALFYHAKMLKHSGANESALKMFEEFKHIYRGFEAERWYKRMVDIEIEGCLMVDSLLQNPADIMIFLLDTSINKVYSEGAPYMLNDSTFIYSSRKTDNILNEFDEVVNKKLYTAIKQDYRWEGDNLWESPFNAPRMTNANACFSPDKNRVYLTRCNKNFDNKEICAIYMSMRKGSEWSEPKRLGSNINLASYTSTTPAVGKDAKNPDREILYFISDRPDGEGGMDIWYSIYHKRENYFDEPRNVGRKLNTIGDEFSLFIDNKQSQLYFASDGWPGIGGLDLFKSQGYRKSWTTPVNLGHPFNSHADDLYFTRGESTRDGFFVSNRPGGYAFLDYNCCDDIYGFRWKDYIDIFIRGTIAKQLEGLESDELPELDKPVVELFTYDPLTGDQILLNSDTIADGRFELTLEPGGLYQIMVKADQYLNKSFTVSTKDYFLSDTLNFDFKMEIVPEKPIVLKNILFEFGSSNLTKSSQDYLDSTLVQVLKDNPDIDIQISAHTDSKGAESFNLKLSEERANSVRNFIISKGIENRRIRAKGYGESKPIAPNENPDGSDNPEGRELNRRVEFEIIK